MSIINGLLEAIGNGDSVAVNALMDVLEETGDERLAQVKRAWEAKLRDFQAEVGLLWTDQAPKIQYPDWRDAIIPVMQLLPSLGSYGNSSRCPAGRSEEVGSLVDGFARVLYQLGYCQGIQQFTDDDCPRLLFSFVFRNHYWWCCLRPDLVNWRFRRPESSCSTLPGGESAPPNRMTTHRYARETALVRYVISSADQYLSQRARRRTTTQPTVQQ
jgi:hypothetical protein